MPGRLTHIACLVACAVLTTAPARADGDGQPAEVDRESADGRHGPAGTARLFTMPIADVVGAYQMTIGGDGSLLEEPGVLSFAGVAALGVGDLAQVEYRHTQAISAGGRNAPVPAIGAQFQAPLPRRGRIPAVALALRLGLGRGQSFGATELIERVADLYLVTRWSAGDSLRLHAGARISQAEVELAGDRQFTASRVLLLPTAGAELDTMAGARLVTEFGLAPRFDFDPNSAAEPVIDYGALGRIGARWRMHRYLSVDSSLGYQIETRSSAARPPGSLLAWDIRMGAELYLPWGHLACRATGAFCP